MKAKMIFTIIALSITSTIAFADENIDNVRKRASPSGEHPKMDLVPM